MVDTRFVARCAYCNRGIRKVYRSEVVLQDHRWFCGFKCRNAYTAGHKYSPWWVDFMGWAGVLVVASAIVIFYSIIVHQKARGHPSDHQYLEWFLSQTNQNGMQCCDGNDSYSIEDTEWRTNGTSYEVRIHGEWVKILPHQLSKGPPNPTGKAALWYTMQGGKPHVYCFRPSTFY